MFLKKQNFEERRSIAIFGNFAKAIVRQNGYKMVDFRNKVLINQLFDLSAHMIRTRENDEAMSSIHLTLHNSLHSHEYGKN